MTLHVFSRRTRLRAGSEGGFTIVELLVVIIILAVLAAIAIPAFLSNQGKSADAVAKSMVREAATAMETCGLENGGAYNKPGAPPCSKSELIRIEPHLADAGSRLEDPVLARDSYRVTVWSERAPTEVSFAIRRESDGTIERICSIGAESKGGCLTPGGPSDDW